MLVAPGQNWTSVVEDVVHAVTVGLAPSDVDGVRYTHRMGLPIRISGPPDVVKIAHSFLHIRLHHDDPLGMLLKAPTPFADAVEPSIGDGNATFGRLAVHVQAGSRLGHGRCHHTSADEPTMPGRLIDRMSSRMGLAAQSQIRRMRPD
jgi:hypothetical protein